MSSTGAGRTMINTLPRSGWSLLLLLTFIAGPVYAQPAGGRFLGLPLDEALRTLQASGTPIVFSSEIVRPDMRVVSEPRAKTTSERLLELLKPHDLGLRDGPRGTLLVVPVPRPPANKPDDPKAPESGTGTGDAAQPLRSLLASYREHVTVAASEHRNTDPGLGASRTLQWRTLSAAGSYIADDPLRTIHAAPGVSAVSDFQSEFSMRASPPRHAAVVVDGMPAPWLTHAAWGRHDTGTLTMLPNAVIGTATLSVGAYPRRDGGQLGPQLNLSLREGSRTTTSWRLGTSHASAVATGEGPIGSSDRGSWLVGLRKGHVEWPLQRSDHESTVFGFTDLQSKVVYDVHPRQQIGVSLVTGISNVERDSAEPDALGDGINRAALMSIAWRWLVGDHVVVGQQASLQTLTFKDADHSGRMAGKGESRAGAYRVDIAYDAGWGLLEVGAQARRVRGSRDWATRGARDDGGERPDRFEASQDERSGYASVRWETARGVALAPGVRVAHMSGSRSVALDRWLQIEWSPRPHWQVWGGVGVAHQLPALDPVGGSMPTVDVRPERAAYLDIGLTQPLTTGLRWSATVFSRRERDVLRGAFPLARGGGGSSPSAGQYENALSGTARGLDLVVEGRASSKVAGWIGYTLSAARQTDVLRQETFRADYDQRHTFNIGGTATLPAGTTIAATFRAGTSVPIPRHLIASDGRSPLGEGATRVALPAYARLDLRTEKRFGNARRQIAVFGEALNVLNRTNYGWTAGVVDPESGRLSGTTERLFPRLVTAGVRLEF